MFKGRQLSGSIDLKTAFNNADIIRQGNNFDEILAGLTMQPSEAYDTNFVEDVSLFILCILSMKRICLKGSFGLLLQGKASEVVELAFNSSFDLLTSLKES